MEFDAEHGSFDRSGNEISQPAVVQRRADLRDDGKQFVLAAGEFRHHRSLNHRFQTVPRWLPGEHLDVAVDFVRSESSAVAGQMEFGVLGVDYQHRFAVVFDRSNPSKKQQQPRQEQYPSEGDQPPPSPPAHELAPKQRRGKRGDKHEQPKPQEPRQQKPNGGGPQLDLDARFAMFQP